ncbi:MAG: hypothetical protein ABIJ48_06745 [Actinomycetota bacterium]
MSAGLRHLARRFFGVLGAARLSPAEQVEVSRLLRPPERDLFWGQRPADQRHGLECARTALGRCPGRPDLARAALLHDVGKRLAGLGVAGRTMAAILGALRLPVKGRVAAYLGHGPAGAADLEAAGAEAVVVGFARHHHGSCPDDIPAADWEELCRADYA